MVYWQRTGDQIVKRVNFIEELYSFADFLRLIKLYHKDNRNWIIRFSNLSKYSLTEKEDSEELCASNAFSANDPQIDSEK